MAILFPIFKDWDGGSMPSSGQWDRGGSLLGALGKIPTSCPPNLTLVAVLDAGG